jgi:hypothetical protein
VFFLSIYPLCVSKTSFDVQMGILMLASEFKYKMIRFLILCCRYFTKKFAGSNKSQAIEAWRVEEIKCNAVLLPIFVGNTARVSEGTLVVFPLLMVSHT